MSIGTAIDRRIAMIPKDDEQFNERKAVISRMALL
jgi:hypothetical protein